MRSSGVVSSHPSGVVGAEDGDVGTVPEHLLVPAAHACVHNVTLVTTDTYLQLTLGAIGTDAPGVPGVVSPLHHALAARQAVG